MMRKKIRLSKSIVGPEEADAVAKVIMENGYLGMGSEVQAFEEELREFIGGEREVVSVVNGTAALHLALQACGIGPGDEVLVPTITYVATFQAVSATGAKPVACDVRWEDCTIDVEDAAKRVTNHTKAIIPVHYASGAGDLDGVYALAEQYDLRIIEDAAHAFGGMWKGKRVGATGDIVCFSFDGIKNITSGEGGAVVTGDEKIADYVRDARLLGVHRDTEKRFAGQRSWDFDVTFQGWRYHMSNIMAAIGRVQLRRFKELASARVRLAKRYAQLLGSLPQVRVLPLDYNQIVPHIFPIFVAGGKRDMVREALLGENIECGIHYKPNHLLSYFSVGERLPVAEELYKELLTIPLHPDLTFEEQDKIVDIITRVVADRPSGRYL